MHSQPLLASTMGDSIQEEAEGTQTHPDGGNLKENNSVLPKQKPRHMSLISSEDKKSKSRFKVSPGILAESETQDQPKSNVKQFQLTNYGPVPLPPEEAQPRRRRNTEPSLAFNPDQEVNEAADGHRKILSRFDEDEVSTIDEIEEEEVDEKQDQNANPWSPAIINHLLEQSSSTIEDGHPEACETVKMSKWRWAFSYLATRGRQLARKHRRMLEKNGECNIQYQHIEKRRLRFITDLFTTFLEIKWRYILLVFFLSFCATWIFFALLWWALYAIRKRDEIECIVGVFDFTTALLFSIETQHTIGYGTRSVTDQCPTGTFLLMVQSTIGVMSQCIVTGIVFAKLARPKHRAATVLFSRNAVICRQGGAMVLMFRVGDMRRTQMMGTTINAIFIQTRTSVDGEIVSYSQRNLAITTLSEDSFFFLAWPIKVMHKITEDSPLWNLSAEDLKTADFEIVVVLEATAETTGGSTQVRTSYLPDEIIWGHKLAPLFTKHKNAGKSGSCFKIDFTQFDKTEPSDTPDERAANLVARKTSIHKPKYRVINERL